MADSEDAVLLRRRARRRLVGAIALVVFTVIVLPIVFDNEPRPISQDLVIQIPSQDAGRFNPRGLTSPPVESPAAPPARGTAAPEPVPAAPPAVEEESPAAVKPKETARAPAPKAKAAATERYVVALGAYTNRENVKQLQAKLSAAGYKHFTEPLKTTKGNQLRVRAGPFASRAAAEQARDKMKAQGLPAGAVVRQEP